MSEKTRNAVRLAMKFRNSPPPPASDLAATVAWLRDRELIKDIYARYAYAIDSIDPELLRSVFHPDAVIVGTMEEGNVEDYIAGTVDSLYAYDITMHFRGNQYVDFEHSDKAFVETWVVAWHVEPKDSPIDTLVLAIRYQDDVVRYGDEWRIMRRVVSRQWHTGPLPRPFIGPAPYPRGGHVSRNRGDHG